MSRSTAEVRTCPWSNLRSRLINCCKAKAMPLVRPKSNMDVLPLHCQLTVFDFCGGEDLGALCAVDQKRKRLATLPHIWAKFGGKDTLIAKHEERKRRERADCIEDWAKRFVSIVSPNSIVLIAPLVLLCVLGLLAADGIAVTLLQRVAECIALCDEVWIAVICIFSLALRVAFQMTNRYSFKARAHERIFRGHRGSSIWSSRWTPPDLHHHSSNGHFWLWTPAIYTFHFAAVVMATQLSGTPVWRIPSVAAVIAKLMFTPTVEPYIFARWPLLATSPAAILLLCSAKSFSERRFTRRVVICVLPMISLLGGFASWFPAAFRVAVHIAFTFGLIWMSVATLACVPRIYRNESERVEHAAIASRGLAVFTIGLWYGVPRLFSPGLKWKPILQIMGIMLAQELLSHWCSWLPARARCRIRFICLDALILLSANQFDAIAHSFWFPPLACLFICYNACVVISRVSTGITSWSGCILFPSLIYSAATTWCSSLMILAKDRLRSCRCASPRTGRQDHAKSKLPRP